MSPAIRGRPVVETDTVPTMPSASRAVVRLGVLGAAYVALVVCAIISAPVAFVIVMVVVGIVETAVQRQEPILPWALRRIGFGDPTRSLVRGLALIVLAAQATTHAVLVTAVVTTAVVTVAAAARVGATAVLTFVRLPAAVSRGLTLSRPAPPPPPPSWLVDPRGRSVAVEILAAVGIVLSVHADSAAGIAVLIASAALASVPLLTIAAHLGRLGARTFRRDWTNAVWRAVEDYRPEVVLYSGENAGWVYQLDMWRDVLESLDQRVLIVVRDPEVLRVMAPTSIPVVCVPRAVPLMQMPLPDARVALYVSNSAANTPFLRRLGPRTAFIGHGDSDKGASGNPFTRVYHEVWVAGTAAHDRYLHAGVDLDRVAFVGRPQLPDLPRAQDATPAFTVLYAPTWEGWDAGSTDTSLPTVGPALVAALLAVPGVRVAYRPHPQTGYRDAAVARAHRAVLELMKAAGARSAGDAPQPPGSSDDVLAPGPLSSSADARATYDAAARRWADEFWHTADGHRILTEPAPGLHDCFRHTDLLIADVSSVVTDWLATDRPYAVINSTGGSEAEFRERAASTRGGAVLTADLAQLPEILDRARRGDDPFAAARRAARDALLGPRPADPREPFRRNIDRLCAHPRVQG